MTPLAVEVIARAAGGRLLGDVPAGPPVTASSVSIDSRIIERGAVFFAIRGDRVDGHDYLQAVAAGGAIAAVVDREPLAAVPGLRLIRVADTREALGRFARHVRRGFGRCKVVAIAGSNGKTSTKHLVSAALSTCLRGSMSPKSFNNDIGVPLTIFPADGEGDFVVVEIGTNHPGEVGALARLAEPDIGVITNCGEEHLEFLGSVEAVRRENACLIEGLRRGGTLIIHGDDPQLLDAVAHFSGTMVRFGISPGNDLVASDVRLEADGTSFRLNDRSERVFVPMIGRHNALNALAAIAVARTLGVPDSAAIAGLAASTKPEMRMERLDVGGIAVLNDAYNANPASVRAAIETFVAMSPPTRDGRRIAVLGDMRELGATGERYHREIGELIANNRDLIQVLICVGESSARWTANAAASRGFRGPIESFAEAPAAGEAIACRVAPGDLVLVKGSRGVRLERVVDALQRGVAAGALPAC